MTLHGNMRAKAVLTALMAGVLALSGCGSTNAASDGGQSDKIVSDIKGNVEITFWHGMTGNQEKTLQSLTDTFMKQNPNIKVTLQNQSSYSDLQQKLTATMQSPKDLPTITQAYPSWLVDAISDGQVVDLDPYITSKDGNLAFDNWDDVLPGLRDGVKIDGKTYGMPFNKSTEVLWYNKTMLDELGLKVPTTYDELAETSKKIESAKGIPGAGFDSLSNYYITYMKNEGVTFGKGLDVAGEKSAKAFDYYDKGVKDGYFRIAGTDTSTCPVRSPTRRSPCMSGPTPVNPSSRRAPRASLNMVWRRIRRSTRCSRAPISTCSPRPAPNSARRPICMRSS